jgi:hypothetical protein
VLGQRAPSSPASTSTYFSFEPPRPTLMRAPGSGFQRVAQLLLR